LDLLRRYSNRTKWAKRLAKLPKVTTEAASDTIRIRRVTPIRLSARQVADLVEGYRAGQTVYELADHFGLHRATVSTHLHRQGVTLRRQGLDDDGIDHAVHLYEQGWSVARIGDRLGVDGGTVWSALKAQGVRLRDAHRRER